MINKEEMLSQMLSVQDTVNSNVDVNWKSKNREWYRAAWVETAELMDSFAYKWWKHQVNDYDNAKIEVIDIWHFVLAKCIECNVTSDIIVQHWKDHKPTEDLLVTIERLAFTLLKVKFEGASIVSVVEVLSNICNHLELSLEDIYIYYIGKATLNNFRQNYGYKKGTYIKIWGPKNVDGDPVEDNEFLTIILKDYLGGKNIPDNLQSIIYSRLKKDYPGEKHPELN